LFTPRYLLTLDIRSVISACGDGRIFSGICYEALVRKRCFHVEITPLHSSITFSWRARCSGHLSAVGYIHEICLINLKIIIEYYRQISETATSAF